MSESPAFRARDWKVYGPDLNGRFGGLQGTGGLEAVILNTDGTTTGVINDQFGNGVATVSGGTVTWNTTRVGAYGPLPGIQAQTLTDVSQLAAATAWRSRRIDPTGFYWLGARYYEPTSGRFLSADPAGHAASPSLYDYAGGDPVNHTDPDGRCKIDPTRFVAGNIVIPYPWPIVIEGPTIGDIALTGLRTIFVGAADFLGGAAIFVFTPVSTGSGDYIEHFPGDGPPIDLGKIVDESKGDVSFPSAGELDRRLGGDFHRDIKPEILKDFGPEAKSIGTRNPDVGVDSSGNVVLRNPQTGQTVNDVDPVNWTARR
jgi:RHS repeat-associated protein